MEMRQRVRPPDPTQQKDLGEPEKIKTAASRNFLVMGLHNRSFLSSTP